MLDVQWDLLVAQVVTFLLGITILWFVAWKPLVARMKSRREELARHLESIEAKAAQIEELKKQYEAQLANVDKKTKDILDDAHQNAQKILNETQQKAKENLERFERQIEHERQRVLVELRSDFANLVSLGIEKVLRKKVDVQVEEKLYEDLLEELTTKSKS